jgi:hypothetical protein
MWLIGISQASAVSPDVWSGANGPGKVTLARPFYSMANATVS